MINSNPLETIKKNFSESPLGQALSSIELPKKKSPEEISEELAVRSKIPAAMPKKDLLASTSNIIPPMPESKLPSEGAMPIATPEKTPFTGTYNLPQQAPVQQPMMSNVVGGGFGGIGQQMKGVAEMQKAEAMGLRDQSALLDEQANIINEKARVIQNQQAKEQEMARQYDEQRKALDLEVEGKSSIDKDRYFKNMSTGNKILTGIGLALSAIGGPRAMASTVELINRSIDQDIDMQEKAYGIAKEKRSAADTLYKQNLEKLGDQTQAILLTKAQNLEAVKAKIDSVLAKAGSSKALAQGEVLKGQLQAQIDQTKNAMAGEMLKRQVAMQSFAPGMLPEDFTPRTSDEAERFIPGIGMTQTKEDRKKVIEGLENASSFNRLVNEAISIRERTGGELFGKDKDRLDAIQQDLTLKLKNMSQLGVMSDSDKRLLEQIIPDISRFDLPGRAPVIDLLSKLQNESKAALAKQLQLRVNKPLPSMGATVQRGGI